MHFNEFQYVADGKTALIKMNLSILISNVAFVSVCVTVTKSCVADTHVERICINNDKKVVLERVSSLEILFSLNKFFLKLQCMII